ncbi:MAG: DMT family transporter [Roseibium sp.]|uniref:DMT family transporter n=1 Tax=Roseibium sp. TaxID=1936156 RepID=UPI00260C95AD|nr:DMT family transporter [Roseibium sp.]MCV0426208.1 DMT family transporter [Roseibium sp.]
MKAPSIAPRGNAVGGLWLLADMSLNIWALGIVKAIGLDYSSAQLVFLRAATGLVLIAPWIWRSSSAFHMLDRLPLHFFRVLASTIALTTSFFAIARLPLALVTAINFTRPILTMVLAVIFLKEMIGPRRWIAAAVAFAGVLVAVNPASVPFSWGLPAIAVTVFAGTAAVILTRKLTDVPVVVMMTFYTGGLAVLIFPLALVTWVPVQMDHIAPMIAIGICAQCAQFCFLHAHRHAAAAFLAILSYLSLPISAGVGFFVFAESLSPQFLFGAALIVGASAWTGWRQRHLMGQKR